MSNIGSNILYSPYTKHIKDLSPIVKEENL